jgi:hypothetical protein
MNNSVRAYMRRIGRKGGKAGKGSPARIEANRRTARKRFGKPATEPATGQMREDNEGK